jgi:protein-tyrosine phosphatase
MDRTHPGRTDIHFHALPGVDDGPPTMEDSLELARLAIRDGTRTVVATPHIRREFLADPGQVRPRVAELQDRLRLEGIPLSVVAGGELDAQMVGSLSQEQLDEIAVGPNGARWLLLEAPFEGLEGMVEASAELRARGFGVVLAHPERAAGVLAGGCRILRAELAAGCVAQVSVSSLTGAHGHETQVSGWTLLDYGLAHVLASDAHSRRRAPCLEEGIDRMLAGGATFAMTRRLVDINPRELVATGMPRRLPLAA